ncbi:hypothetical protein ACTJK4_20100, partial [Ralstonia sp. 22111]|uniref:hypothetical protein n=1 Tax=Ralstonia sp. 22111 TaxID=3453878 RepID=UPI003F83E763
CLQLYLSAPLCVNISSPRGGRIYATTPSESDIFPNSSTKSMTAPILLCSLCASISSSISHIVLIAFPFRYYVDYIE